MITSSTFTFGQAQFDGRVPVLETHTTSDGRVMAYEWLSDGTLDPQMVLDERAAVINQVLAAREAARVAVSGTDVPWTKHEFLSRFTMSERIAIRARAKTDDIVVDFMEMLSASGGVFRTLAAPGVAYLKQVGILTAERAAVIGGV